MGEQEKITEVEEELRKTKYNKATEHHVGSLLGKLSRLKKQLAAKSSKKKGKGYSIKKQGHATAIFVGFPSVGKSTLLNLLTNAQSKVAAYDFTTLTAIPGMMEYHGARIQLVDLPGIIKGASEGRGKGKQILAVVRNADLIIIVVDSEKPELLEKVRTELYSVGVRLDEKPPSVKIVKKLKGGLDITSVKKQELSNDFIKSALRHSGIINAEVIIKERISKNRFIDALFNSCHYAPSLIVFNKVDKVSKKGLEKLRKEYPDAVFVSAREEQGVEELKEKIFDKVNMIRVFLKPQHGTADMKEPLILEKDSTVHDLCTKLHKDFVKSFKYAMIWGNSARFPGQKVGTGHVLKNDDVVTVIS